MIVGYVWIYLCFVIKIWLVYVRECFIVLCRCYFFYFFYFKMVVRVGIVLLFFVVFIFVCSFVNKVDEEEICRRYVGG